MASPELSEGERAYAARRRRLRWIVAGTMVVGAALGWLLGQNRFLFGPTESISPALAIGASIAIALVFIGFAWFYFREIDELDLRDNLIAGNIGLAFYVLAFPIWITLSRAGVTPRPSAEIIYASTLIVTVIAYYWKRLRP